MKCGWLIHDGASRRQVFEKRTGLSFSRAFLVPDRILGIIAISRLPKTKESCLSGRFLSEAKGRQARRFIGGSVIDTVGARGFLKLIEPNLSFIGFPSNGMWPLSCISFLGTFCTTRGEKVNTQSQRKCAYSACECPVTATATYCSVYCSQAERVHETEIQCDCKHHPCAPD
jgi:hypothetical protein